MPLGRMPRPVAPKSGWELSLRRDSYLFLNLDASTRYFRQVDARLAVGCNPN